MCPRFQLHGPSGIVADGRIVPYYVRWTDGTGDLKPVYKWRIFGAAELVGGQGTMIAEVKVSAPGNNTVSVEIGGMPEGCENTASETLGIDLGPEAIKLDEYTGPLTRITKRQVGGVLRALKENPGSHLFVALSGGKQDPKGSISRKRKILDRDLLSDKDTSSVTIVEHLGRTDDKLSIWIVPPGAPLPYQ